MRRLIKPITDKTEQIKDLIRVWNKATIDSYCQDDVDAATHVMILHKDIYAQIDLATGVPWYVVGSIHGLEGSNNFHLGLANGYPWNKKATIIPYVGPYKSWYDSAIDALNLGGLDKIGKDNWDIGTMLWNILKFNGFGCYTGAGMHSTPPMRSAYLWSMCDNNTYQCGKYIADRKWSYTASSDQVGAAAILKNLIKQGIITL